MSEAEFVAAVLTLYADLPDTPLRPTPTDQVTARRLLADELAGESMTAQSVFEIVERYSNRLGVPVAPHDLRRRFAKLAHRGRAPLEQIQLSLGHASVQTTERYLGLEQDLVDAPCDHLGLRL